MTEIHVGDKIAVPRHRPRSWEANYEPGIVERLTKRQVILTNDSRWWRNTDYAGNLSLDRVGGRETAQLWTAEHEAAYTVELEIREARAVFWKLEDLRHEHQALRALLPELRALSEAIDREGSKPCT